MSLADVKEKFPRLFNGLGNFREPYKIKLKDDAKPYALFTSRNVAIPLRAKVFDELNRMESLGVISKVNEPTSWCAGLMVVPKKSGDICLCIDLKVLNESVMRETHLIPKVEDSLSGAALFTKLDGNSGFWQIPLALVCSQRLSLLLTDMLSTNFRLEFQVHRTKRSTTNV